MLPLLIATAKALVIVLILLCQGIRGEHGVIASGRVIPMLSVDLEAAHPSSTSHPDVNVPNVVPAASPPRTSPRPPTPVPVFSTLKPAKLRFQM